MDLVKNITTKTEFDLFLKICCTDLQITTDAIDSMAIYLPQKHAIEITNTKEKNEKKTRSLAIDLKEKNYRVNLTYKIL